MRLLLQNGGDVDLRDHVRVVKSYLIVQNNSSALHWACAKGQLEIVRMLLEAGSVVDAINSVG